ncbi:hypothetical protein GOBAR_AA16868 [Gossypium barbadense]|uniref:PGG domain-containing protein n=1 Tax=Gossypium barbadense TaxID=3634 RepID=A0A2P5XKA9_GOSBA|nr:hypothetical protein GOBAR_AA16868 [Gossypium barbadense]
MDVNQSQQQNLSHSSSSSTPSQSGDGPDGGGLSPVDEDDGYSGDRGEIRSSSQYGGEYGVGTTSGHFPDRSEFDGNMFPKPRRDRKQPSYFQPSLGYPQPYGYYPPFPNYGVPYQPQMHSPPPMYHPPPPLMYPPPQIYPPHQLYENQCQENQVKNAIKVKHRMFISSPSSKLSRNIESISQLLWDQILSLEYAQITDILRSPSQVLFVAAEFGVVDLITELFQSYPDLIWRVDEHDRSIFHMAVIHRQEKIFRLIHDRGAHKDMIAAYRDKNNHCILHLAGKIATPNRLNIEVEKNVQPLYKEMRDSNGRTPRMLFMEEHAKLMKEGEKWMKSTASSCMLVATLITTMMFAAIFTVPGGNDNEKGTPIFLEATSFVIFAVSDALALFSSVTSILMFLSILTSRYAEEDFLRLLPQRLIVGLTTLFLSIAAMLVAFGATFCIVLSQRLAWIAVPVAFIACIPVTLFAFLQFPLHLDIIQSSYGVGIFA